MIWPGRWRGIFHHGLLIEAPRPGTYICCELMGFCEGQIMPGRQLGISRPVRVSPASRACWVAACGLVALGGLLTSCGSKTEPPSGAPLAQTNAAEAEAVSPELAKLTGKWERSDDGYRLEIKSIDASGKVEAAYYNPNPIRVSRAAAWREQGISRIVVELNDTGYPGCLYTLEFNAQTDQLVGQYFQAAQQATYEIVFFRIE